MTVHLDRLEPRRLCAGGSSVPDVYLASDAAPVQFRANAKGETATVQKTFADSQGRIYVVATTQSSLQIRRLTAYGALDRTFGNGRGILVFSVSKKLLDHHHAGTTDVTLDPADRLYVLIGNQVTRYTAAGTLDTGFGNGGTFTMTGLVGARQIVVDASNKIWVAGSVSTGKSVGLLQFTVVRLISRGKYDYTFDGDGKLTLPLPGGNNGDRSTGDLIRVLDDGSVVAAAAIDDRPFEAPPSAEQARGVQVAHFRRNGTLDKSFGTGGVFSQVTNDTADVLKFLRPEAIRPDGSVVLRSTRSDVKRDHALLVTDDGTLEEFHPSATTLRDFYDAQFFTVAGQEFAYEPDSDDVLKLNGDRVDTTFAAPDDAHGADGGVLDLAAAGPDNADGTVLTVRPTDNGLDFSVGKVFADARPVAALNPAGVVTDGSGSLLVFYKADAGVNVSTVNGDELRVVRPDGTSVPARLRSATSSQGTVQARYAFATDADAPKGPYTVDWLAGSVASTDGAVNAKRTIGTLVLA